MIKERCEQKNVHSIEWIDIKNQLADIMTKSGVSPESLLSVINNDSLKIKC